MAKKPLLEVINAHYVGLRIRQGTEVADLDFAKDGGGSFRVCIPLYDLVRLQNESERKHAKEKLQVARESRKSDP